MHNEKLKSIMCHMQWLKGHAIKLSKFFELWHDAKDICLLDRPKGLQNQASRLYL